jgi:hypothetical protein
MTVLSYIPCIQATQPPNEGVRRGAVGSSNKPGQKPHSLPALDSFRAVATKRKTPAFCGRPGPIGRMGCEGLGAGGHAHPARKLLNAAAPIQFLPPHLVFECCGPAPQGCRKAFLAFRLATLPRAGTPWEGKRGVEVWLCAPLLFKCAPQRTAAAKSCLSYAVPLIPGSVLKRVSSANVALSANSPLIAISES